MKKELSKKPNESTDSLQINIKMNVENWAFAMVQIKKIMEIDKNAKIVLKEHDYTHQIVVKKGTNE